MERKKAKVVPPIGEDMISMLPNSLISHILSSLPIKEAVRTSVLSKRWESLWLSVPVLDLNNSTFPNRKALVCFTEKFIEFSRLENSSLHKLKLSVREDSLSCVTRWIAFVATPILEDLDVECHLLRRDYLAMVPLSLYVCESLLNLRLHEVMVGGFKRVSLPCLKTMHLERNIYANETCLELLVSSCPVLDVLNVVRRIDDNVKVYRVHSRTLSSLSIKLKWNHGVDDNDYYYEERGVSIDAPRLEYFYSDETLSLSKTVINSSSLKKVILVDNFDPTGSTGEISKFFTSISRVADMKISSCTFEHINWIMPFSPRFCNLTRFEAHVQFCTRTELLEFLKSCPNLKSLELHLFDFNVWEGDTISGSVPQCLLTSLEFVEIRCQSYEPKVKKLVTYVAENSTVMKELSLIMAFRVVQKNAIALRDLLVVPTRSSACKIAVVGY